MALLKSKIPVKSKIRIKLRAYDHRILDKTVVQIIEAAQRSGAKVVGPVPLPTERTLVTVLRSPHVHKDSREQFATRVHKRLIDVLDPTPRSIETLGSLDLPAGVDIEIKQ